MLIFKISSCCSLFTKSCSSRTVGSKQTRNMQNITKFHLLSVKGKRKVETFCAFRVCFQDYRENLCLTVVCKYLSFLVVLTYRLITLASSHIVIQITADILQEYIAQDSIERKPSNVNILKGKFGECCFCFLLDKVA